MYEGLAEVIDSLRNGKFGKAVVLQRRVLWSLCLREVHGLHGKFRIGYLWEFIKVAFGVAVFWWIREMANFHAPMGMENALFILLGIVPWHLFQGTISRVMEAIRTNKALLTFPQITPLDLCVSSALVVTVTITIVIVVFILGLTLAGYNTRIYNMGNFIFALVGLSLFSIGVGLVLTALNYYFPVLEKFVPMVLRIMFFTSGVFFSPHTLPSKYADIIMLFPVANYIETFRGCFVSPGIPEHVKVGYTAFWTIFFLASGLLLERFTRRQSSSL